MSNIHIIVSNESAKQLLAAQELNADVLGGEVIVLNDNLSVGPIYVPEGATFTNIRDAFYQQAIPNWEKGISDEEKILELLEHITVDTKVWFWMAPNVADINAYYWLLPYFMPHEGLLHTVFINKLPFFNEKNTLFYPKYFKEVLPREMVKCAKLLKDLSPADYEVDIDEWPKLCGENAMVRSHEGDKKLLSRNENHHDGYFLNQFQFGNEFTKANKVMSQALSKLSDAIPEFFLQYRFKQLIAEGKLDVNGNTEKGLKDFEVKKAIV
jgi:hypothetical protein